LLVSDDSKLMSELLAGVERKTDVKPADFIAGFNHKREQEPPVKPASVHQSQVRCSDHLPNCFCVIVSLLSQVINHSTCNRLCIFEHLINLNPRSDRKWTRRTKSSLESIHSRDGVVLAHEFCRDSRRYFTDILGADQFQKLGLPHDFVQPNQSDSKKTVIRGLHLQWNPPMGKLMRVAIRNGIFSGSRSPKRLADPGAMMRCRIVR